MRFAVIWFMTRRKTRFFATFRHLFDFISSNDIFLFKMNSDVKWNISCCYFKFIAETCERSKVQELTTIRCNFVLPMLLILCGLKTIFLRSFRFQYVDEVKSQKEN